MSESDKPKKEMPKPPKPDKKITIYVKNSQENQKD